MLLNAGAATAAVAAAAAAVAETRVRRDVKPSKRRTPPTTDMMYAKSASSDTPLPYPTTVTLNTVASRSTRLEGRGQGGRGSLSKPFTRRTNRSDRTDHDLDPSLPL